MVSWVKAPFTLFQEPIKVLGFDAIKFAQLTLFLVPKVLDSIDVILSICEQFWVVDSSVMKITYIKSIVRSECVCVNDTVRGNFFFFPAAPRPRFPLHVSRRSNSHQLLLPPTVHSSVAYWLWAYVKAWKKLQLYCGELLSLQWLLKPWLLLRTSSIVLLADDSLNDYVFHTYFCPRLLS